MNKQQLNTLNELMQDADFKGKQLLDWLIWRNTNTPKYKVGDFVQATDYSMRIYGHQVIDFNAKVVNIGYYIKDYQPHYELEIVCKLDGKEDYKTNLFVVGNEKIKDYSTNNINYLGEQKSKYSSELTPKGLGL